jgi:DNA modification methylase
MSPVHPENSLNELTGDAWLYFTKSVWTTAYPSELGHALRKAHGANKPPRLMARLIEFFTRGGELVLDPFAGVGGTLLGAAIARPPRRALGFEIDSRWAEIYTQVVREATSAAATTSATSRAAGTSTAARGSASASGLATFEASPDANGHRHQPFALRDLGDADPGGPRSFDASGCEMRVGDAAVLLAGLPSASVDFVATDPPYNVQLRQTMAGGPLAEAHANRRTDYAMVTDEPADLANSADYAEYLARMAVIFGELRRVLKPGRYATVIVRDAYQRGRYRFVSADLAERAEGAGFVLKGDVVWYQAGTRLRPYGYPRAFVPNIAHQHILVLRQGR